MKAMHSGGFVREPLGFRLGRTTRGVVGLLRTRYPRFLLGLPPAAGEIPVFTFHDVETGTFVRQLEFLQTNGYRAVSLDEYLTLAARGNRRRRCKEVLLTFDDARISFHRVVLPVLRAHRSPATLFVPSLWMGAERPPGGERFMNWPQVRECVASGWVDVASHAHRHALVFVNAHLRGFATPRLLQHHDIYDWPMRHESYGERFGPPAPGAPLYGAAPLLSARGRYIESPAMREACTQLVEREGAAEFFTRPDSHSRLLALHRARAESLRGHFARDAEFTALVASEFELNRAAFKEHLGFTPTALAYPWALGSAHSLELARRFGIRCAFGAACDYRRARALSRAGGMPLPVFGRLRADWLELLPGKNRTHLLPVLARKIAGFAGQQHLAH